MPSPPIVDVDPRYRSRKPTEHTEPLYASHTIGTTVVIGSAGCVQSDEPTIGGSVTAPTVTETENQEIDADLEFTAAAVGVGERALSEANYEERRAFDHGMTRTYELGNQSFTAEVVSQLAEYHRRVDTWRSVASVEYAAELVPDAEFALFEDSGHCPTLEESETFNRVLGDFVDSL